MYREGEDIKKNGLHLTFEELIPYAEQLVYRMVSCGECFENGSCTACGCGMPEAAMVASFPCEDKKFDPMPTKYISVPTDSGETLEVEVLDPEAWETIKKERGIKGFLIKN